MGTSRLVRGKKTLTSVTTYQRMYKLAVVFVGFLTLYDNYKAYFDAFSDYKFIFLNLFGTAVVFFVTFICHIVHTTFFNRRENVLVYFTLQKVNNFLNLDLIKGLDNGLCSFNIYFSFGIYMFIFFGHNYFFYLILGFIPFSILTGAGTAGLMCILLEVVLQTELVFYLTERLKFLKSMFLMKLLREFGEAYEPLEKYISHDKRILSVVDIVLCQKFHEFLACFNDILSTFKMTAKIYKFQVPICCKNTEKFSVCHYNNMLCIISYCLTEY